MARHPVGVPQTIYLQKIEAGGDQNNFASGQEGFELGKRLHNSPALNLTLNRDLISSLSEMKIPIKKQD